MRCVGQFSLVTTMLPRSSEPITAKTVHETPEVQNEEEK